MDEMRDWMIRDHAIQQIKLLNRDTQIDTHNF